MNTKRLIKRFLGVRGAAGKPATVKFLVQTKNDLRITKVQIVTMICKHHFNNILINQNYKVPYYKMLNK